MSLYAIPASIIGFLKSAIYNIPVLIISSILNLDLISKFGSGNFIIAIAIIFLIGSTTLGTQVIVLIRRKKLLEIETNEKLIEQFFYLFLPFPLLLLLLGLINVSETKDDGFISFLFTAGFIHLVSVYQNLKEAWFYFKKDQEVIS